MTTNDKISVITVCYNAIDSIEKTIISVLGQKSVNVEYVIIDGDSTDGTVNLVNKYMDNISCFISEPDKGIYDAMNKGIKNATSDWLFFMNAGDVFVTTDTLSKLCNETKKDLSVRIIRGNIIRRYPHFSVRSTGVTKQKPGLMDMMTNTFHHQACLIQRSLFLEFGYYSTDYKLCSDWKFFFDCVAIHHVKTRYINEDIAYFEMDGATSQNTKRNEDEQIAYLKSFFGDELYYLLQELAIYRRCMLCRCFFNLYSKLRSSLSPQNYSRVLTAKRFVRKLLGKNVN